MNMELSKKEIEQNMMYIQNLPVVHQLLRKIDKLKRKNKELKTMVRLLTKESIMKPKLERGQYIDRHENTEKEEENIKLIIDTDILEIESDETEVVNPQSECSVVENKWENNEDEDEEDIIETEYEEQAILAKKQKDEVIHVEEEEEVADDHTTAEGADGGESPVEEEEDEEEEEEVTDDHTTAEGRHGGKPPVTTISTEEGADGGESPVEDDDEEVMEIIIKGKTYYTTDDQNGVIYDLDEDGEISVEVGYFKNGKHYFNKK
jgi:hypothetical protein